MATARKLPRPFTMPWGGGSVVAEAGADTQYNELVVQLLEYDDPALGRSLRFCQYWPDGRFQRQPMLLNERDIPALRDALHANPEVLSLLRALVEG
jgi:hypothetical protein